MNGQLDFSGMSPVDRAISRLREYEPDDGYFLAFSGGKDSVVVYALARAAGVAFDAHYHVTTVDPPELVHFIRREYPGVIFEHPEMTMWQLIVKKRYPPTRIARYCCEYLKERGGEGRWVVTGVRWAESANRRRRRAALEMSCTYGSVGKRLGIVNPVIDWTDADVWGYIHANSLPYCSLYDEGFARLGCVMCPMKGSEGMRRDALRWPKIAEAYRRACRKSLNKAIDDGLDRPNWRRDSDDMYDWWLTPKIEPNDDAQGVLL